MAQPTAILQVATPPPNGAANENQDLLATYIPEPLYWEKYYEYSGESDARYEWNNGYLEELPMTDLAEYRTYQWFVSLLRDFLHVHPMALMIGLEMGFRLALPHKVVIRKPDLGVVLNSNPTPLKERDRSYRGVFDVCIESVSNGDPRDVERDVIEKLEEYAVGGVQEYYILDEARVHTRFYRLTRRGVYTPLPISNGVVRSLVLPGFQLRIDDLYAQPWLAELVDDPIYSSFASPDYRAQRLRTEEAERRAEEERQRAKEERQRAKEAEDRAGRYAEILRAAGLLPKS